MKNYIIFTIVTFVLFACSSNTNKKANPKQLDNEIAFIDIETIFKKNQKFDDPKNLELLKELKICDIAQKDENDFLKPACSPFYFKFFKLNDKLDLENSFLLQIKSKTGGFPLRRVLIFERERGELVKANGFVANLIGVQKSKTNYANLLLRFNDNIEGEVVFYNCVFEWTGKKYDFKYVRDIEGENWGGPVKLAERDSVSKEIYKILNQNTMLF